MSKVVVSWRVPRVYNAERIEELFQQIVEQVSLLSEGKQASYYQSRTSAPTTGSWARGDWVKNSAPTEAGGAGSRYMIFGWLCVTSGTPGTWREMRVLTGN